MAVLLHLITYVCIAVFVAAVIFRFSKFSSMPMHVRWELYPVAHEAGKKATYGGSMLEEVNWWEKPREVSMANELKVMIPEMLFLHALWEHNRSLWFRSFPFHFGLYNMMGFLALLMLGAVLELAGVEVAAGGGLGGAVFYVTPVVGFFGMILGGIGTLGLLHRRLTDPELTDFTTFADKFNLVFIFGVIAVMFAGAAADPGMGAFRNYVGSVITFDLARAPESGLVAAAVLLASLLVAYIPLTHMSHFFVKWFSYHKVRWEDQPNLRGGAMEGKIGEVLNYPISWGAKHIGGDGKTTWAEVCTRDVKDME